MKYFLLSDDYAAGYMSRRGACRAEHLANAWRAHERGELLLAGALALRPPMQSVRSPFRVAVPRNGTVPIILGPHDIHVWYRNTESIDVGTLRTADQTLSREERARCNNFRSSHDRRDFTIAHDLLRRSLSKYEVVRPTEWQFDTNPHGKPIIKNSHHRKCALSFNLSHTRGLVACAITSSMPVGLDVERVDRALQVSEIAERYFSPSEAAGLRHCPDHLRSVRFLELWTLKEAFLKAVGLGLSQSLASASFEFHEDGSIVFTGPATVGTREWHFALFEPSPDTRIAVAVHGVHQPSFSVRRTGSNQEFSIAAFRATTRLSPPVEQA